MIINELYNSLNEINKGEYNDTEKWQKIATIIDENNELLVSTYWKCKNNEKRKLINLDYENDVSKLIDNESDELVMTSYFIIFLHQLIYNLLVKEGNYYLMLNGNDEMQVLKNDIKYYISISIKNEQNIYFHAFILLFALESIFTEHFYVGVDFEYTNRKIQLAQLNFEHSVSEVSIIMIVSPPELNEVMTNNFINLIMCNKYIKKILHGSDSLDIPYVYTQMLENDPVKIRKFTRSVVDTRFLCEYYKLSQDVPLDNRCSIYDEDSNRSAIYYFKLISDEQQQKLSEMLQSMPVHHDREWNVHKMAKSQIIYAQYDVIFLKYFYYRILYVASNDESSDSDKKDVIQLYKHVLFEMTQMVYLERNNITSLFIKCKSDVDVANNYFIKKQNGIAKLIDIYNQVSVGLITTNPKVVIDKLIRVNHFRILVMTIIKRLVYGTLSTKCHVNKDKNSLWSDKLENDFIFEFFEELNFKHLASIFRELDKIIIKRISDICGKKN
jgi:hypothetical protein